MGVPPVKLGVFGLNSGPVHDAEASTRLAPLAEELGYDSWWAGEHVVLPSPRVPPSPAPPEFPMLDPLVHLAFVAALTSRIALATGIIIIPQRNPLVLAKQVASLDVVSGGRFWFGIGVGYLEPEFRAIGVPFDDRGPRTDEYIDAMQALWNEPAPISFSGERVRFEGVDANPRPIRPGGPLIVVGGHSGAAYRRAVARGHQWYGFFRTPEQAVDDLAKLRRAAEQVERPEHLGPLETSITPAGRLDDQMVDAYREAGVERLVTMPSAPTLATAEERLAKDAALVLP
jgi:probable F420-dependent oxidoreductase